MKKIIEQRKFWLFTSSALLLLVAVLFSPYVSDKDASFSGVRSYASQFQENIIDRALFLGEDNSEEFEMAAARGNVCARGTKRCFDEDIPQRCDTVATGNLAWNNVLEDGLSCADLGGFCLRGECIDYKSIELLSQPKPYNINTVFHRGGVDADVLMAANVIDKWQRANLRPNVNWDENPYSSYPYAPNYSFNPDRTDDYWVNSSIKFWVADDLGPEISHCPSINEGENYQEEQELPHHGSFQSCGYTFNTSDFPILDYGQNCHRSRWQAWEDSDFTPTEVDNVGDADWSWPDSPGIDIGTAYKDCLYSGYSGNDFYNILETAGGACDPYTGDIVNLDCESIALAATEGPNSANVGGAPGSPVPPVFPNECIPGPYEGGVWDWYEQRPSCTLFEPGDFKRERVCLETWEDCVPVGEGTPECYDYECEGGSTSIGTCIHRSISNPCYCPSVPSTDPPGEFSDGWYRRDGASCDWDGGPSCEANLQWLGECDYCDIYNDEETCNNPLYERWPCYKYRCSWSISGGSQSGCQDYEIIGEGSCSERTYAELCDEVPSVVEIVGSGSCEEDYCEIDEDHQGYTCGSEDEDSWDYDCNYTWEYEGEASWDGCAEGDKVHTDYSDETGGMIDFQCRVEVEPINDSLTCDGGAGCDDTWDISGAAVAGGSCSSGERINEEYSAAGNLIFFQCGRCNETGTVGSGNCDCVNDDCQKGYRPCIEVECVEHSSDEDDCIRWECDDTNEYNECTDEYCAEFKCLAEECAEYGDMIWQDMDCYSDLECPEPFEFREAEDCCKRWYWKCSAGCVTDTRDCYEGRAVAWRPDFKYATFHIGDPADDCEVDRTHSFTIGLFVDRNSPPWQMEVLIENANNGLLSPHIQYTELEYEGKTEVACVRTSVDTLKNIILNSGKFLSGDGTAVTDDLSFDFEEYLSDFGNKYIDSISFRQTR